MTAVLAATGWMLAQSRGYELQIQQPVFAGIIQPILQERCVACHGPEKHKADLRLDSFAELLRGGQNGAVIKPGLAKDSFLLERMLLPLSADGHMPPEDQPQPTTQEVAVLEWWLKTGAPETKKVAELNPGLEIREMLESISRRSKPEP